MKRKVRVKTIPPPYNAHVVEYVERRKYQRHWAAQFYSKDVGLEWVKDWVRKNPKLELVD